MATRSLGINSLSARELQSVCFLKPLRGHPLIRRLLIRAHLCDNSLKLQLPFQSAPVDKRPF